MANNDFFDCMFKACNPMYMSDFFNKMMSLDHLSPAVKKNMEVVKVINEKAMEGMQKMFNAQATNLQKNASDVLTSVKTMSEASNAGDAASKHYTLMKQLFDNVVNQSKSMIELSAQVSCDLLKEINQKSMDVVAEQMSQTQGKGK